MPHTPLVSVILPNFNYALYLHDRIEGILSQSFQDIELILLDDKSTDESASLMRQYESHPKVSALVVNEVNSGSPFHQWSKGISLAKGKYIWIAEADDEASPTFLETCVEALESHPSASLCYACSTHIDSEGNVIPRKYKPRKTSGFSLYDGQQFARRNLYWRNYIENASGVVFLKEAYARFTDTSWMSMRTSGDWLFWFYLSLQGDVIRIHAPLNHFRIHQGSVTASAHASRKEVSYVEGARILSLMEESLQPKVSVYRHLVRVGQLYHFVHKYVGPEHRANAISAIQTQLHLPYSVRHLEAFNRLFRWLPGVVTMKGDALPDTW